MELVSRAKLNKHWTSTALWK